MILSPSFGQSHLSGTFTDKPKLVRTYDSTASNQVVSNGERKGLLRITASSSCLLGPDDAYELTTKPPIHRNIFLSFCFSTFFTGGVSIKYQPFGSIFRLFDDIFNGKGDFFIIFMNISEVVTISIMFRRYDRSTTFS